MSATVADIKNESGGGGKQPNKNNGDQGPSRPLQKPKRPETKPYYALYVNGQHIRVHYLREDGEDWPGELRPGYAVAWVEEKTSNVHFFLFRLGSYNFLGYLNSSERAHLCSACGTSFSYWSRCSSL